MKESIGPKIEGESSDYEEENNDTKMALLQNPHADLRVAEEECKDAISQMLACVESSQPVVTNLSTTEPKVELVVEYQGKAIFKSTLVAELNGNPFLSKDRLTRIKSSIYFNNGEEYLSTANSSTTYFLGLGSDCGVLFVQSSNINQSFAIMVAQRRNHRYAQLG